MNTNFVVINKANELYDYSFRYIINCLKGNGNIFRNSLENELYELIHNIFNWTIKKIYTIKFIIIEKSP